MDLGAKFWLGLAGACVGAVIVGSILFILFGLAWSAWGFLGAFLGLALILLAVGYIHDRREQNRRRRVAA
ncbi:MAG: hypothetical protein ACJ74L_06685 [Gaiellaceae bacterium]|jgi:hypothetical protein